MTYDYVAYALARHRGIRTVMFEYVASEGLLTPIEAFEDGLPPILAAHRRLRAAAGRRASRALGADGKILAQPPGKL